MIGGNKLAKKKEKWAVFWHGDDGKHFLRWTSAVSEDQARNNVYHRWTAGQLGILRSRMYAKQESELTPDEQRLILEGTSIRKRPILKPVSNEQLTLFGA